MLCRQALSMLMKDVIATFGSSSEGALARIDLEGYDQFKNIDTNYLFEKYCVDHLGCLVNTYITIMCVSRSSVVWISVVVL
jgi:hypothetical protein